MKVQLIVRQEYCETCNDYHCWYYDKSTMKEIEETEAEWLLEENKAEIVETIY